MSTIIPQIMINDGWSTDDVETIQDCDDAFAFLTVAIANIEETLAVMRDAGDGYGPTYRKAHAALRFKRAAFQIIQGKRGQINRRSSLQSAQMHMLAAEFKAQFPDAYRHAIDRIEAVIT